MAFASVDMPRAAVTCRECAGWFRPLLQLAYPLAAPIMFAEGRPTGWFRCCLPTT